MSWFPLPHHPSLTSVDPLGICDADEEQVSQAALLTELLNQAESDFLVLKHGYISNATVWIKRLQRLLEDIAYSLHQDSAFDAEGLVEALKEDWTLEISVRTDTIEYLFHSARQLAVIYPDGQLPYLSDGSSSMALSTSAVDAILAHMFLGTFQIPPGNTWGRPGFCQYYDGKILPAVRNTAPQYLRTVMTHFSDGGYRSTLADDYVFTFKLSTASTIPELVSSNAPAVQVPVKLVDVPCDPSPRTNAFVLVAANAQPGPGAGGTHEERLVGQSPALAIAPLLTPVLKLEEAVITSALPVHAAWQGHGRTSEMLNLYPLSKRPFRHYMIADALPLDLSHGQADLRPGNVQREVRKLYAAFTGAKRAAQDLEQPLVIEMPPWGCGAFGGSLNIKVPCMMIAAGLAGIDSQNLELLVPKDGAFDMSDVPQNPITVGDLYATLVPRTT